jgi:hypothetical protein
MRGEFPAVNRRLFRSLFLIARYADGAEAVAEDLARGRRRQGGDPLGLALLVALAHGLGGIEGTAVFGKLGHVATPCLSWVQGAKHRAIPEFRVARVARIYGGRGNSSAKRKIVPVKKAN